jgi:hypothetical protein
MAAAISITSPVAAFGASLCWDLRSPGISFFASSIRGPQQAPVLRLLGWEQVRRRYVFEVIGYVVMPEHFHLLISEPERGDPSTVMKVLKQTVARKLLSSNGTHFWQPRFYDFNVFLPAAITPLRGNSLRTSCEWNRIVSEEHRQGAAATDPPQPIEHCDKQQQDRQRAHRRSREWLGKNFRHARTDREE